MERLPGPLSRDVPERNVDAWMEVPCRLGSRGFPLPAFAAPPHVTRTATRCIVLLRYPFGFQSMAWGCITPSLSVARAQTS